MQTPTLLEQRAVDALRNAGLNDDEIDRLQVQERTPPTAFPIVCEAILTERFFQEAHVLPDNGYRQFGNLQLFAAMVAHYASDLLKVATHHEARALGDEEILHVLRKIAAICVRGMERHGAPVRPMREILNRIGSEAFTERFGEGWDGLLEQYHGFRQAAYEPAGFEPPPAPFRHKELVEGQARIA